MLCYLAGMEPYHLKCIKDGPSQPKTAKGDDTTESKWTPDERRVVIQDQILKSIIMSCIPDDIIESVISCEKAKATWTDLVHSLEGPLDTKENMIMDLNLSIKLSRLNPLKVSHRPTPAIRPYSMSLPMILENANQTQPLDLTDIYRRFVYEDKLIKRSQAEPKIQKDYKAEYKNMKAKLALLEENSSTSQTPNTFQPKKKGLLTKIFDWDEEEVSADEEVTQVKVLMALADDELT
nr:hypothetical protein [Tanacetum cinerariifolium]